MALATLLCWFAWGYIIWNVDPTNAGAFVFLFFYISLFLSFIGTISLIVFAVMTAFAKKRLPLYKYVQKSFHLSMGLSALLLIILFMQEKAILTLWNVILFILLVIVLSAFVLTTRSTDNIHT